MADLTACLLCRRCSSIAVSGFLCTGERTRHAIRYSPFVPVVSEIQFTLRRDAAARATEDVRPAASFIGRKLGSSKSTAVQKISQQSTLQQPQRNCVSRASGVPKRSSIVPLGLQKRKYPEAKFRSTLARPQNYLMPQRI